eukprot:15337764-Ditylum_brightwellii.AAC.1
MLYFKNYLDQCIHVGIDANLVDEYIGVLLTEGYHIMSPELFISSEKHNLILQSDKSIQIQDCFCVKNYNTAEFDTAVDNVFKNCDLYAMGQFLLCKDNIHIISSQISVSTHGQPSIINFGHTMQNSTEQDSIPGLNVPKLTQESIKNIKHHNTSKPLMYHILDMMSHTTLF